MITHAVSIRELRKSFGLAFNLGPVTLDVPRGAICALVGPNGAGKTTLMNLLMGVGRADYGSAELVGYDIRSSEVEVKRRVAYVSPDLSYRAWGTVGRAIDFVSGFYPDWNAERCELLRFMQDQNRTIIISSHQLSDLERFADHVAVMQGGQIMAFGTIPDLLERFVQLDVHLPLSTSVHNTGLKVITRQEDRARLLLDRWSPQRQSLSQLGVEVFSESPLTLEELFIALMKTGRMQWQPRTSAA